MKNKKKFKIIRAGIILLMAFLPTMSVLAEKGDATGVDSIFEEIGLYKPAEWEDWSRDQRHAYLQDLGLYPEYGDRYRGEVTDLSEFFSKQGLEQPENWSEMSFEEKNKYLTTKTQETEEISETETVFPEKQTISTTEVETITETGTSLEPESSFLLIYQIVLILITIILLGIAIFSKDKARKIASFGIYYGLPIILAIFSYLNLEREFFDFLGKTSEILLIFLLFIKPISVFLKFNWLKRIVASRRQLGIASFWYFAFHFVGLIYTMKIYSLSEYGASFHFWGLIAGFLMILLSITSNNYSVKFLKKNWKRLQYLAYPALFVVLAHSSLSEYGNLNKFYLLSLIYLILKIIEFFVSRKKKATQS